jgi:hypothetical protein
MLTPQELRQTGLHVTREIRKRDELGDSARAIVLEN